MHDKAKEWDKAHGVDTSFATGEKWPSDRPIPNNRPCDVCGEPVERGFIHKICQEKELKQFFSLM